MSRRTGRNQGRLDLKLTMGTGRAANGPRQAADAAAAAAAADGGSPETSPTRSCVSSEESLKYSSSPEATSMVLVGCPRCLMYVMLSETDPRCPKCKSSVLLDFLRQDSKARLGN